MSMSVRGPISRSLCQPPRSGAKSVSSGGGPIMKRIRVSQRMTPNDPKLSCSAWLGDSFTADVCVIEYISYRFLGWFVEFDASLVARGPIVVDAGNPVAV